MKHKILYRVINCDKHTERLAVFRKKATEAGLKINRLPCVDGTKISDSMICKWLKEKKLIIKKLYHVNMTLTTIEIAITLSHAKCWQEFLDSKAADYLVVFEDDAMIAKRFQELLSKTLDELIQRKMKWDILWLYNGHWIPVKRNSTKFLFHVANEKNLSISKQSGEHVASGTAYIITRAFAKKLLDKLYPIAYPVDVYMGNIGGIQLIVNDKKKKMKCPATPLVSVRGGCGGPYGTGAHTTQQRETAKQLHQFKC